MAKKRNYPPTARVATAAREARPHEVYSAVLEQPRRAPAYEALRRQINKDLMPFSETERHELVALAVKRLWKEDPSLCKVFIRKAIRVPNDIIASDNGLIVDTVKRWAWKAGNILLNYVDEALKKGDRKPPTRAGGSEGKGAVSGACASTGRNRR